MTELSCHCGKTYGSERGLKQHQARSHKEPTTTVEISNTTPWPVFTGNATTASMSPGITFTPPAEALPKRKIAIIGWAGTSRDLAPWADPTWEKWGLNTMAQHTPYAAQMQRLYQIHSHEDIRLDQTDDPAYWQWMVQNQTIPIYMHFPQPEIPMAVQFPTEELLKKYRNYFTNTVSWMIAHAIEEGADTIGVWGVDMAAATEYAAQRPSCEYFLGIAEGKGIEIVLPPESDLLRTAAQYGLANDSQFAKACTTRIEDMQKRVNEGMAAQNANAIAISRLQGGLEVAQYFRDTWCLPQTRP